MYEVINKESFVKKNKLTKMIKKNISKKNKVIEIKYNINPVSVIAKIETKENGLINKGEILLNLQELINLSKKYLKKKNIIFIEDSFDSILEHIEGDSREPMDYGYKIFKGISFKLK